MRYIIYESVTGEIVGYGSGHQISDILVDSGCTATEVDAISCPVFPPSSLNYRYDITNGIVVEKDIWTYQIDLVSSTLVINVTEDVDVLIDGLPYTVSTAYNTLIFTELGEYIVVIPAMGIKAETEIRLTIVNQGMALPNHIEVNKYQEFVSLKLKALKKIDDIAENLRYQLVTPGSAQSMVYIRKEQEAKSFMKGEVLNNSEIPYLIGESEVTGTTVQVAAASILGQRDAWVGFDAPLEKLRRYLKTQVQMAANRTALAAIPIEDSFLPFRLPL